MIPEVEVENLNTASRTYKAVPVDQIIVYVSEKYAPKHYVPLARLKSSWNSDWLPKEILIDEFKKKAGELGANAVIVLDIIPEGSGKTKILTGLQPDNDFGYHQAPFNSGITVVTPGPINESGEEKGKVFKGDALAVWTTPPSGLRQNPN